MEAVREHKGAVMQLKLLRRGYIGVRAAPNPETTRGGFRDGCTRNVRKHLAAAADASTDCVARDARITVFPMLLRSRRGALAAG